MIERLESLTGILFLMMLGWIFSETRRAISWKTILSALALNFLFAALVFLLPQSTAVFLWLNRAVLKLLSFSTQGSAFLFGSLAVSPGAQGPAGEPSLGFFLAFQMFPALIFFSALTSLAYRLGLIQPIIRFFAVIFKKLMRLSGAEALSVSSNIFVGIEAVFPIRPYLEGLTRSELFTIMTACMATVASTTLAIYVSFLKEALPSIAGHLISASVISIPAAVIFSKLMIPETNVPSTLGHIPASKEKEASGLMEAVTEGAMEGLKLAAGIGALLVAVLSLVALANFILQRTAGFLPGHPALSIEKMLGWTMIPFVKAMGISAHDLLPSASLLGERWILTEVVAYRDLAQMAASGLIGDARTLVVMSYALCGFTHMASVAIFVGGLSALVPSRKKEIAGLGFKALAAAFLATVMTGCLAGFFFSSGRMTILGSW
ncbi:MAG: nucleoside transporter [Candidatus Omnitrophica bacterium]|nr:nucleoside transporter [Candidatus Omnitrophota bacterium]